MATIKHARTLALQATSPRIVAVTVPTNVSVPNAQVNGLGSLATQSSVNWATQIYGTGMPANYADNTTTILTASGTSIVMTNANLFKSASGVGGVFIGSGGLFGKNSSGTTTFSIDGATGDASFLGDITTAGKGQFDGDTATIGGWSWAVTGGSTRAAAGKGGVYGRGVIGVWGLADVSNGSGVYGQANYSNSSGVKGIAGGSSWAVWGDNSGSGVGVRASSVSGTALQVEGPMTINNTTLVSNLNAEKWNGATLGSVTTGAATANFVGTNKPGSTSSSTWLPIVVGGTTYYIPVWT